MKKKFYKYQISVTPVEADKAAAVPEELVFQAANQDNIIAVAQRLSERLHFEQNMAFTFTVGLKLLTQTILENSKDPLFEELTPAMVLFMKRLKQTIRSEAALQASKELDAAETAEPKAVAAVVGALEVVEDELSLPDEALEDQPEKNYTHIEEVKKLIEDAFGDVDDEVSEATFVDSFVSDVYADDADVDPSAQMFNDNEGVDLKVAEDISLMPVVFESA